MKPHHTDKKKLIKGIKYLALSLPLAFSGPSVLYSVFGNRDKPLFIPILILGLLITFAAAYCIFKGINVVMRALFND